MKLETAHAIASAAEKLELDVTVREGYSGRGMFGRTTTGLIGSQSAILTATALAAGTIGILVGRGTYASDDPLLEFVDDLNWRWDSMGLDMIAY